MLYQAPHTNIGATTTLSNRGFAASVRVPAAPLDEILDKNEKETCTLIKMDIEGAEIPVLQRFVDTFDQYPKRPALAVEASDNPEWEGLFSRLLALGYQAFDLHNNYDWLNMAEVAPAQLTAVPKGHTTDILFLMR